MNYNFVTIEGCIGSGKTTLASKLANEFNAKLILEAFENNPFLPKFYEEPERFAFPLELFFMAERYKQLKDFVAIPDLFQQKKVSDYLFTKSLIFANITLKEDENALYKRLFSIINAQLPQPELIVYLHNTIPNLLHNIAIRGRSYEQNIKPEYLEQLQSAYLQYFKTISNTTVLIVDASKIDFVNNAEDYEKIKELFFQKFNKGIQYINL
jgi:deoxyadenosine/deoxycytidine kinase